uniref:Uncharacterized protein n=1 Tax=Salix viminalis TaxID=40686 RepID=A0A6N2N9G5_SALVM
MVESMCNLESKASVVQTTVRSLGTQMSIVIQLLEAPRKTILLATTLSIGSIFMNTGGGSFEKVRLSPQAKLLFGMGLNGLVGEEWALHRRIRQPGFDD